MKTDLATSIGLAILGAAVAFVICNMMFGEIEDVSFKTIGGNVNTTLQEPDEEVFNYKALNPTVEVYIGD
ncbi:MAG: hypothetical protein K6G36_00565 [Candidatus Saccharibacteria bacterium]|nr:hypothetical protein [Candidatus Saccharibacteria bacterium]